MRKSWLLLVLVLLSAPVVSQVRVATSTEGRLVLRNDGSLRHPGYSAKLGQPASHLVALIERHAVAQRLDPLLVRAVIQVESAYNPAAVSHKGAMGLMQLMPQTAAELSVEDPFDSESNVRGGTRYLRYMLDIFDDQLPLALAGYNAGPEAVRRYDGVPPYQETRQYVRRVMRLYQGAEFTDIPDVRLSNSRPTLLVRRDGRLLMTNTGGNRR